MKFIDWFADGSVYVVDLALACCGVESGAAVLANAPVREEIPDGAPIVAVSYTHLTLPTIYSV